MIDILSMKSILRLMLVLMLVSTSLPTLTKEYYIVGYVPTYKDLKEHIPRINFNQVTHINLAFLNPDKSGRFISENAITCALTDKSSKDIYHDIQWTVNHIRRSDTRVLASLGGALKPACSGNWFDLLQVKNRSRLIDSIMELVTVLQLDGIDIDIEGERLQRLIDNNLFDPFIKELSGELKKHGKYLTTATASYEGGMVTIESMHYFDWVMLMSYDAVGPTWGDTGDEHATTELAEQHMELWLERGLEESKLILGLPLYGYGFGKHQGTYTLDEINQLSASRIMTQDIIGRLCKDCDYITYNSINTLIHKTRLARQHGAGVMIWELTQDISSGPDQTSALEFIHKEINRPD